MKTHTHTHTEKQEVRGSPFPKDAVIRGPGERSAAYINVLSRRNAPAYNAPWRAANCKLRPNSRHVALNFKSETPRLLSARARARGFYNDRLSMSLRRLKRADDAARIKESRFKLE